MTDDEIEFISAGFHRLYCTPYEVIRDGPNKGRRRLHPNLRPARGTPGCDCVGRTARVYRHYPNEYVTIELGKSVAAVPPAR